MQTTHEIVLLPSDNLPYPLLLSADPSRAKIDEYLPRSLTYGVMSGEVVIACGVLCPLDREVIEIKNIAVEENFQNQGIAQALLRRLIAEATLRGYSIIRIGTGNSSIKQLYLYQKAGFRIVGIRPNYFLENYSGPIMENGIECRDMIILERQVQQVSR